MYEGGGGCTHKIIINCSQFFLPLFPLFLFYVFFLILLFHIQTNSTPQPKRELKVENIISEWILTFLRRLNVQEYFLGRFKSALPHLKNATHICY